MTKHKIRVSVVVPVFNGERFVLDSLRSVCNQSFTDWECLIVDDASTDNSIEIIRDFIESQGEERFRLLPLETNSGVSVARNVGIQNAKGQYIAFLDCDDLWSEDKLMRQIRFMDEEDVSFSFCAYRCFGDLGVSRTITVPRRVTRRRLFFTCPIYTSSVVLRGELLEQGMAPHLRARQDYVAWMSILSEIKEARAVNVDTPLMFYRLSTTSISADKKKVARIQWDVYVKELSCSRLSASIYFLSYVFFGILKRRRQTTLSTSHNHTLEMLYSQKN